MTDRKMTKKEAIAAAAKDVASGGYKISVGPVAPAPGSLLKAPKPAKGAKK